MTISKRHVIAVALLGILLILSLRPWQAISGGNSNARDARRGPTTANESSVGSHDLVEPTRTKSRIRTNHPQPTIEETIALLRTTIIPVLDLPADQPLPERIAGINELITKAGVEPCRLRLILRSADPASQWRIRHEFRTQQIPLRIALKYLCDSSMLRYHVRENGIIELTTLPDQESLTDLPDSTQNMKPSLSGETDIFGNDLNALEAPDPFAGPPAR